MYVYVETVICIFILLKVRDRLWSFVCLGKMFLFV